MTDLVPQPINTLGALSLSAQLFKNIESFPGQVLLTPSIMSAKQEGKIARKDAVRGGRQIERTSAHIAGGLDRSADMVIGPNLVCRPAPDWEILGIEDREARKKLVKQLKAAFRHWGNDTRKLCDAEGHHNFSGMMWMAFRNLKGPDGESAGVIHYDIDRRREYATAWATFVTVIDPDRIETPPDMSGDKTVYEGKKLDKHGRYVGMYVRKGHPSEGWTDSNPVQHELVPRETWWGRPQSWHIFSKTRGGQQRGLTKFISIIRRSTMLDQFDDHHLGAAAIAALVQTYIKTTAGAESIAEQLAPGREGKSVVDYKLDYYADAKIRTGTQRIPLLAPDDEIKMESVGRALADPTMFRNGFMREFGMALGLGQGQIANSFADFNYSSARAELMEVYRGVLRERAMFTASPPSLIYSAVIEEAVELGIVEIDPSWPRFQENRAAYCGVSWTGPGMGSIDPLKEAMARKVDLETKHRSHTGLSAEDGFDFEETLDQIAADNEDAEERDIDLTIDPKASAQADAVANDTSGDAGGKTKKKSGGARDGDGDGVTNEDDQ